MKTYTFFSLIFFLLFFCTNETYSQDSLYLVDTLTGTATNNKLWKAQGIDDFNGDGYTDFIVCYNNYTDLCLGNPNFTIKHAHRFNTGFAYGIGDVNGDGYKDLMLISSDSLGPYGEVIVGGKEIDIIPKFRFYIPIYWHMSTSTNIYELGDLNKDGYNDFAIASPYNWTDGLGRVYLFKGGETLVDTPWVILKTTLGIGTHFFGSSVLGIGDYNDDSYDDFLVTDPTLSLDSDKVYLYLGNKDSINAAPYKTFGPPTFHVLSDVKAAGDLNGGGKRDFIISSYDNTKAYIYLDADSVTFDASQLGKGSVVSIGTGGDINNDGFDDFLIGSDGYKKDSVYIGKFVVFFGKPNIDTSYNFSIEGYQQYSSFAKNLSIPGDLNGDGYADVFVLAPSYRNYDNVDSTVGRLYIYSYKKVTGINKKDINPPTEFRLNQNYPNPFNPTTVLSFQLSVESYVTLKVYTLLGQELVVLKNNEIQSAGEQKIAFDANKYNLSSGVYFLEMNAVNTNSQTTQYHKEIKMLYLK
ncbi:MAG: FG-GAP-like repeat-containing protein [Ignavibacteria bacterium]|nr:FG-GAP-like repeat-containing protein [Ignavibacteria bacterium]